MPTIFFYRPKFSQLSPNESPKMPLRRFGGLLYNLLLGDKLLCSLTTILRRVISVSREHDQLKFLWARTIRKVRGVESGGGWFLACKNFFLAVCLCKKGAIIFRLIATLCRNYFSAKFASSTITVVCMVRKHDGQQSER